MRLRFGEYLANRWVGVREHGLRLCSNEAGQLCSNLGMSACEYACRKQRGVDRARLPDAEGSDRHTPGHLHDRQERVESLERLRFHRHAEYRQQGLGRDHTWKVRGPSGAGNDYLDATIRSARDI